MLSSKTYLAARFPDAPETLVTPTQMAALRAANNALHDAMRALRGHGYQRDLMQFAMATDAMVDRAAVDPVVPAESSHG